MFTRFASILQHAVDAFVPDWPLLQEFVAHWKAVTQYFVDRKDYKVSIEQTPLPGHIARLVDILIEEEAEQDGTEGAIGSCMEYLLQHRILETLYTLARTDCPPGMKQIVLQSFTRLMSRISQPTLPHISVHRPVLRLVRLCGEIRAGPSENDEVLFLCTLCAKIKTDPYLVNFFIESPKGSMNVNSLENSNQRAPRFTIADSLLNLLRSEDARVSVKACEGLILLSSLPDDNCARHIIENTTFIDQITSQLCSLYSSLPKVMDPGDIESVDAKWGLDMVNLTEDRQNFHGKRQLVSFLSWIDFCDQMITSSHQSIGCKLADNVRQRFLVDRLEPAILHTSESVAITATAHLCRCLRLITSDHLIIEFVYFILGDESSPESDLAGCSHRLRKRLIERCDHISDELCITTWKLFEVLLCKPHWHVVHNLVLRNLVGQGFVDSRLVSPCDGGNSSDGLLDAVQGESGPVESSSSHSIITLNSLINSVSNENLCYEHKIDNCAIVASPPMDLTDQFHLISTSLENGDSADKVVSGRALNLGHHQDEVPSAVVSPEQQVLSLDHRDVSKDFGELCSRQTSKFTFLSDRSVDDDYEDFSPLEISDEVSVQQLVYMWLNLMPEKAKTSCQSGETGYDTYLREAEQQYHAVSSWYAGVHMPTSDNLQKLDDGSAEISPFYEGSFLNVLLNKLSRILHQSYEVNLQVTSVLSRLSLLPHPVLHDYILNPCLQLKPGVRTIYSVLHKVSTEVSSQLSMTLDLPMRLLAMRRQLLGSNGCLRRHSQPVNITSVACSSDMTLLAGIIVLEEFCKELAAITFVKHYNSSS